MNFARLFAHTSVKKEWMVALLLTIDTKFEKLNYRDTVLLQENVYLVQDLLKRKSKDSFEGTFCKLSWFRPHFFLFQL